MSESFALHFAALAAGWLVVVGAGTWVVRRWTGRRELPRPSWVASGGIALVGLLGYLFLKYQFTSARAARGVLSELEDVGLAMLGSWGVLQLLTLAAMLRRPDGPWPRRGGVAVAWALGLFLPLPVTWSADQVLHGLWRLMSLYV